MSDVTRNTTTGETDLTRIIKRMVVKSENGIVTIAPGIAKRILDEINYDRQRPVDMDHVWLITHLITDGLWDEYTSDIQICVLPDGSMVLVNGQHRLHAFAGLDQPTKTKITLKPVKDYDQVRKQYAVHDHLDKKRTDIQLVKASGLDAEVQVSPRLAEQLVKSVVLIENNFEDVRTSHDYRLRDWTYKSLIALKWDREAKAFQSIIDKADPPLRKKLLRTVTMAVVLYTLRYQREKALYFWGTLAENDGLAKRDPRNTLHIDLLTRNLGSGNRRQGVQQSAFAWNAWFSGRQLKIIKCITGAEINIAGTPLAKGGGR